MQLYGKTMAAVMISATLCGTLIMAYAQQREIPNKFQAKQGKQRRAVMKQSFGKTADGTEVDVFTLTNKTGMTAKIMTYGATLISLQAPDKAGKMADVTLGFDNLAAYLKGHPFFGSIAGRVANRVANGKFTLEGKEYTLAINNGPNSLHGGIKGFDKKVWGAKIAKSEEGGSVQFTLKSPDGDEGYPGTLSVSVTYTLTNENELKIEYAATTDKTTPLNLTNHTYFNLAGTGNVHNHIVQIFAEKYTPVDATMIPTGEIKSVQGTAFDFLTPRPISERIEQTGGDPAGYDHNYVLNAGGRNLSLAAEVYEPTSGRVMRAFTTEPGMQFYTGNFLDGTLKGRDGTAYQKQAGFCFEMQHFPDSVNQPKFPSTILKPGDTYKQTTIYAFSTR